MTGLSAAHPTDMVEPKLAIAHRSDEIRLRLAHAAERLLAAVTAKPGPARQGNVAALRSNLDEALDHAHRLIGVMREFYAREAAEYAALVKAMGTRASPAPENTFAHLAESIVYHLSHASRHADSMAAGGTPELFKFDAEHVDHHVKGAQEHVAKFQTNLKDSYPVEAGWLSGLEARAAMSTEVRTFPGVLEVRGDGRTICGLAVPVGVPARVASSEYGPVTERFAPGSIDTSVRSVLLAGHPNGGLRLPVGTGRLAEEPGGFYGMWKADPGGLGDHVLGLVRRGEARGLSVGFTAIAGGDDFDARAGTLTRRAVALDHVALVGQPAYPDAQVLAVRGHFGHQHHEMDANAPHDKAPYGWDVEYADPGYQPDKVKRYPLDIERHVRAAWGYINHEDNAAKYTAEQLARIKSRIRAAARKFHIEITDDGEHRAGLDGRAALACLGSGPDAWSLQHRDVTSWVTSPVRAMAGLLDQRIQIEINDAAADADWGIVSDLMFEQYRAVG